mmetsp:Transcript_69495/g.163319  ORF Transcript_69495/g.163319 Transcript_69495/m.163319 type:complete len:201 (+) Transcript_69495:833-1435(+)
MQPILHIRCTNQTNTHGVISFTAARVSRWPTTLFSQLSHTFVSTMQVSTCCSHTSSQPLRVFPCLVRIAALWSFTICATPAQECLSLSSREPPRSLCSTGCRTSTFGSNLSYFKPDRTFCRFLGSGRSRWCPICCDVYRSWKSTTEATPMTPTPDTTTFQCSDTSRRFSNKRDDDEMGETPWFWSATVWVADSLRSWELA